MTVIAYKLTRYVHLNPVHNKAMKASPLVIGGDDSREEILQFCIVVEESPAGVEAA